MFVFPRLQTADADADNHADAVGVLFGDFQFRMAQRFFRGDDGELGEAIHALGLAFIDGVERREIADLAGEFDRVLGRINQRDRLDAASSLDDARPKTRPRRYQSP